MAGHLVSALVSGLDIGDCTMTDVEPAHFWSQGPLGNGVRSWQLIINHDLKHPFLGWALGIRPMIRVPHR